jgi:hypothetical protein
LDVVNLLPLARQEDASPAIKSPENFMVIGKINVCIWIDTAQLQKKNFAVMIKESL